MPSHVIVSTLAFSRQSLAAAIGAIAALEFSQIDLAAQEGWAHVNPSQLAEGGPAAVRTTVAAVRDLLPRYGMRQASACNVGLGTRDLAEQRRRLAAVCDLAAGLGVPVITIGAAPRGTPGAEEVGRLRDLVPVARDRGVTLTVETHVGQLTEGPAAAIRLCEAVDGLGLTLDASHYYVGPNEGADFSGVFPYVRHVHVRDAGADWEHLQVPAGSGRVDIRKVVEGLHQAGYGGKFAIEHFDSLPFPGGQDVQAEIPRTRDWLVAAERAAGIVRVAAGA